MAEWTPESLAASVMEYARLLGACSVGIVTRQMLEGGPPSTDLTYVLSEAESAVSFAVPLTQSFIDPYLAKKDRLSHEKDNIRANTEASGIACALENFLEHNGYKSKAIKVNEVYRQEVERGKYAMMPDISLRYLAARSGVGFLGLSGNILTKKEGAAVILGAVVTEAKLTPTEPIPPEENYCDKCGLCLNSCLSGMMDKENETTVILGDIPFIYAKRREYMRCEFVCGGMSGLHPSKKWSTWSPGRFHIPEKDEDFYELMRKGVKAYYKRPDMGGGTYHILMKKRLYLTCGNCQLLCHPDKKIRLERFKTLTQNGVIIQRPDGSLERVTPEKAEDHITAMNAETQALYQ